MKDENEDEKVQTHEMKVEVITITPEMAQKFLDISKEKGGLNRTKRFRINKLKHEMAAGRWVLNSQSIAIAKSGKILDGHHRLMACVESGHSFPTVLVTNCDENSLVTIDLGFSRNVAETLHLTGHEGPLGPLGAIGKAAGWIINQKNGDSSPFGEMPPTYIIEKWLQDHQDLEKPCLDWVEKVSKIVPIPKQQIAYAFFLGALKNHRQKTEAFLEKVATGLGLQQDDPEWRLREFFTGEYIRMMNSRNKRGKPTSYTVAGRILKCLRASLDGTKMEKLTFTAKEPLPDLGPTTSTNEKSSD